MRKDLIKISAPHTNSSRHDSSNWNFKRIFAPAFSIWLRRLFPFREDAFHVTLSSFCCCNHTLKQRCSRLKPLTFGYAIFSLSFRKTSWPRLGIFRKKSLTIRDDYPSVNVYGYLNVSSDLCWSFHWAACDELSSTRLLNVFSSKFNQFSFSTSD